MKIRLKAARSIVKAPRRVSSMQIASKKLAKRLIKVFKSRSIGRVSLPNDRDRCRIEKIARSCFASRHKLVSTLARGIDANLPRSLFLMSIQYNHTQRQNRRPEKKGSGVFRETSKSLHTKGDVSCSDTHMQRSPRLINDGALFLNLISHPSICMREGDVIPTSIGSSTFINRLGVASVANADGYAAESSKGFVRVER